MDTPLLQAENLHRSYDAGRVQALRGVDLTCERGEHLSIVGPSGCGKSTLLHLLGVLDVPDEGRVLFEGRDVAQEPRPNQLRARSIGFVFQMHNLLPTLTAVENVEIPLHALGVDRRERRRRAQARLEEVGLAHRATHRPMALSGGERQRVAVARALVNDPRLVLADEPTGSLDQAAGAAVLDLLQRLVASRDLALIVVTHDPVIAARSQRLVRLLDGRVV